MFQNSFVKSNCSTGNCKLRPKFQRPLSVKECKRISQYKNDATNFSKDNFNNLSTSKQLSNSTPNINRIAASTDKFQLTPKHNCQNEYFDSFTFKANPLPNYYSSPSVERNKILFHCRKSKSLERLCGSINSLDRISVKEKSQTLPHTIHKKPFYPPSKYPNIHDKFNNDLQRLIETRQLYKTPNTRKSMKISKETKQQKISSPNLNIVISPRNTESKFISTNLLSNFDKIDGKYKLTSINNNHNNNYANKLLLSNTFNGNQDQMDYSPEININKINGNSLQNNDFHYQYTRPISIQFYYPKSIPNPFYTGLNEKKTRNLY